jgi:hypothetical protein
MANVNLSNPEDVKKFVALSQYDSRYSDYPPNFVPPGLIDPHYVPPYRGTVVVVICWVTIAIATIIVCARLAVRRFWSGMTLGWDDWIVIPALIVTIGFTIVQYLIVRIGGVGKHAYDATYRELQNGQILEFANYMWYSVSVLLIKLSILLFYRRLTPPTAVRMRRLITATIIFFLVFIFVSCSLIIFSCKPLSASWNLDVKILPASHCMSLHKLILALSLVYTVGDIWMLLLPMPMVWKLQLPKRTKIGIIFIFSLGGIACASSVLKMVYIDGVYNTFDPTWHGIFVIIWNQLETTLGITIASLPALNIFLVRLIPSTLRSRQLSRSKRTGGTYENKGSSNTNNTSSSHNADIKYMGNQKQMYAFSDLEAGNDQNLRELPIYGVMANVTSQGRMNDQRAASEKSEPWSSSPEENKSDELIIQRQSSSDSGERDPYIPPEGYARGAGSGILRTSEVRVEIRRA